jgi:hypothetical protein
VEANVGAPQVAYKEAITGEAEGEGKFIKQSGGRGQYGHCWLKLAPRERGAGFEYVDAIKGGAIPREYIPAIEKGIKETLSTVFWLAMKSKMSKQPSMMVHIMMLTLLKPLSKWLVLWLSKLLLLKLNQLS